MPITVIYSSNRLNASKHQAIGTAGVFIFRISVRFVPIADDLCDQHLREIRQEI